jgi:hypothetical protein
MCIQLGSEGRQDAAEIQAISSAPAFEWGRESKSTQLVKNMAHGLGRELRPLLELDKFKFCTFENRPKTNQSLYAMRQGKSTNMFNFTQMHWVNDIIRMITRSIKAERATLRSLSRSASRERTNMSSLQEFPYLDNRIRTRCISRYHNAKVIFKK